MFELLIAVNISLLFIVTRLTIKEILRKRKEDRESKYLAKYFR